MSTVTAISDDELEIEIGGRKYTMRPAVCTSADVGLIDRGGMLTADE